MAAASKKIISWLTQVLGKPVDDYEISVRDNHAKDYSYLSYMIFVSMKHLKFPERNMELIIKKGCDLKLVREQVPLRHLFQTENYIYEKVFTTFKKFENQRVLTNKFNSFSKWYGKMYMENTEIIVFNNLDKEGYKLCDRRKGMPFNHCKLVLDAYSKFHGLSLALKDQDAECYMCLTAGIGDVFKVWLEGAFSREYVMDNLQNVLESLEVRGDIELYERYKEEVYNIYEQFYSLFNRYEEKTVILHGDNWNNNYMFKYKDGDTTKPCSVVIVDWQLASVRSPIVDVAKFLFAVCTIEELSRLEELLAYYHDCLTIHLRKLGSDSEELFSFADLREHWLKYAWLGVFGAIQIMKLAMIDKKKQATFDDLAENRGYEIFDIDICSDDSYYERIRNIISVYFETMDDPDFLNFY